MVLAIALPSGNISIAAGQNGAKRAKGDDTAAAHLVQTEMRNVMYHFNDKIVAHIRSLNGELVPTAGNAMPVFDEKNSFDLRIANAEIAMNTASLTSAFNTYVFASAKSPLKDVTMTIAMEN
jgi:hypothetical protein